MKTETASPTPRHETARTANASSSGAAPRAQPGNQAAPADLFAQLLSAQETPPQTETATKTATHTDTPTAPTEGTLDAEAMPLATAAGLLLPAAVAAEPTTTPAPLTASDAVDPRAAFWALLQPDQALKGALEKPAAPGEAPLTLDPGHASRAATATSKGTEPPLGWTASNPAGRAPAKAGHGASPLISETALLQQRPGLELPPPLPLADSTALLATKAWHMLTPGQPGSALMDTPLTASSWGQAVATAAGGWGQGGQGQASSDGSPQGGASQARVWLDQPAASAADIPSGAEADFAMSLGEAMGDAYEALGTQVSVWSAANTKRASMTVDLGLERALEVDVTLNDGKAQLAFRTDDLQVRENLRTQAETILSDLLARSGIALDSLSVGGQQTGRGQEQGAPGQPATRVTLQIEPETAQRPNGTLVQRTGQGRAGLDVYA